MLDLSDGLLMVDTMDGNIRTFSQSFACPDCQISIDEIEPRSFSFNNPFGACPDCFGLGYKMEFDIDLMIPDKSLSISQGAIAVMGWQSCTDKGSFTRAILDALAKERGQSLPQMALSWLLKDSDVTSVLIGASKPEQILSNIGIVGHTTFAKEELDLIDQISKEQ